MTAQRNAATATWPRTSIFYPLVLVFIWLKSKMLWGIRVRRTEITYLSRFQLRCICPHVVSISSSLRIQTSVPLQTSTLRDECCFKAFASTVSWIWKPWPLYYGIHQLSTCRYHREINSHSQDHLMKRMGISNEIQLGLPNMLITSLANLVDNVSTTVCCSS
ncbi:hypothetical protein BDQ17DRAFT_492514 [Cyathus striatus]|nr:hypothetical protein BDQ17DRAFT_492514 [Cyathus striatus]